jgi:toxin CptA
MRSSNVSVPCRFELRPSRWLIAAMLAMAVLASLAVLASAMPRWGAWPLAVSALAYGLFLAQREASRPVLALVIDGEGAAAVDGHRVEGLRIDWRGPLAFVSWFDATGRAHRHSLWPDALSPALRRELRLAVHKRSDGQTPPSMAP